MYEELNLLKIIIKLKSSNQKSELIRV